MFRLSSVLDQIFGLIFPDWCWR